MRAPIDEFFGLLPEHVALQAFSTELLYVPTPTGWIHLAVFCRVAKVPPCDGAVIDHDGYSHGIECVAYPCDEDGRVFDWEKRYEVRTVTEGGEIIRKLRALMANGAVPISNYDWFASKMPRPYRSNI